MNLAPAGDAGLSSRPSTVQGSLSSLARQHLESIRSFYDAAPLELGAPAKGYRRLLAHYYNLLIPARASVLEVGCGSGELLRQLHGRNVTGIDISERQIEHARARVPHGTFHVQAGEEIDLPGQTFDYVIVSDTVNQAADVQEMFSRLRTVCRPETRLLLNFFSSLWRPAISAVTLMGLKAPQPQSNWLARSDVLNLLELADWEPIKMQERLLLPVPLLGLEWIVNRLFAPLLPWLCLTVFCVARPRLLGGQSARDDDNRLSVSVVIPARNEAGNIEAAVKRTPAMGASTELIFIEGHSRDNTWEEIQRVALAHPDRRIKTMRQTGRGKGNAVREAFAAASGDILMILDADLTMPPEELPKYYDVIASGHAEFANGVRMVYPMEGEAMQFLNLCANKTFSILFSWMLGQTVKDTLCGTKVLARTDYEKIAANRAYFGDFDPFGDFDLMLGADKLNLKIRDVPIRYRDRSYGSTNIHRWSHGWLLLRMVLFAARKLKFV